jgi:peptidoglycan/xylan/chitin deacetylase (PgdA/CDA1 family)
MMLSLFAPDDYAGLGLATVLDIERIPYRRIARVSAHDQPLLVAVGPGLSRDDCAAIAGRPALVLHGGIEFAADLLGARQPLATDGPALVPLSEPLWSGDVIARARDFGIDALRLPRVPLCRVSARPQGVLVASLLADDGASSLPAAARRDACLWVALDLGTAFAHLLTERYAPVGGDGPGRGWLRRAAETAYYAAPQRARVRLQAAAYRRLERRLRALGERASAYPIDASGWLVVELVRNLIVRAGGRLVSLARWPNGHAAAGVLTHDLEPRRYAYTDGLSRLLSRRSAPPPAAFGVVATAGRRHLDAARRDAVGRHPVYCHGLDHRGEPVHGRRRVARALRRARALLQRQFGRTIDGYRSPRLDRSPDLDRALDEAGFVYDSSYPDVDRENLTHYGRGVRLNLPYRPLLETRGGWRPSRCLELPLTAPDCIQPLFAGADASALAATVERKAAFVRASGGLHVALVHAGVFGAADAQRREAHLAVVTAQLRHPDTWWTDIEALVDWWRAREALDIVADGDAVRVVNRGPAALAGARLVIECAERREIIALPVLAPGAITDPHAAASGGEKESSDAA